MAAEMITPRDEISGIPLSIRPVEWLPLDNPQLANRHHAWHPSNAPELDIDTVAGAALRRSRITLTLASHHNIRTGGKWTYHDFYKGPELPTDETEIFNILVASCAGYIPQEAIDLSSGKPKRVRLTQDEMDILRTPAKPEPISHKRLLKLRGEAIEAYTDQTNPSVGQDEFADAFVEDYISLRSARAGFNFHHISYGYKEVRDFFRQYVLAQDLSHIKETDIEEFLTTKDDVKRRTLGHWLLSKAVDVATEDVNVTYLQLRQQGGLHPKMPPTARALVKYKLGPTEQRDRLATELGESLRERVGLAA